MKRSIEHVGQLQKHDFGLYIVPKFDYASFALVPLHHVFIEYLQSSRTAYS